MISAKAHQLAELRIAKGWTQQKLADKVHVDRSIIAHWERGTKIPGPGKLERCFFFLQPDAVFTKAQRREYKVTTQELSGIIQEIEKAGKDDIDLAYSLCTYAYPMVLCALIQRASGNNVIPVDARSIQLFFDHRKEVREEMRLRSKPETRNVSPVSEGWLDGEGVTGKREKPNVPASEGESEQPIVPNATTPPVDP